MTQPTPPLTRSFPMKKLPRSDSNLSNLEDGVNVAPGSYGSFGEEKKPLLGLEPEVEQEPTLWDTIKRILRREYIYRSRVIILNRDQTTRYPANVIRNQKYNPITFLPVILFEQFKYFFNLYFLLVALSQFIPQLQVGFLFTYIAPLAFVLSITIGKEAWDDFKRYRRDKEANGQMYMRLTPLGREPISSADIKVGQLIILETNQRVPADMLLLKTTEKSGGSFIRTDQLDGETDWKLRRSVNCCQKLQSDELIATMEGQVYAEKPKKDIYSFIGNFTKMDTTGKEVESISVENTLWSNTVIASGTVIGLVMYTGRETRSVMNTSTPATKVGLIDMEINRLSKILFVLLLLLSLLMTALKGFRGIWYIYYCRYLLLFSSIIPISVRVNLDLGKTVYAYGIMKDKEIPDTVVRTSTIPEELGRIEYLLSDKTGTLTQNDMVFKKLHLGSTSFTPDTLSEIVTHLSTYYSSDSAIFPSGSDSNSNLSKSAGKAKRFDVLANHTKNVRDAIAALALCHNVTPVVENDSITYQASSPDEVALVKFTESVGLVLAERTLHTISLRNPAGLTESYEVLNIFPFTSESKRMGIIVKDNSSGAITFFMKGADSVMAKIVVANDWLDEECGNLAREGLRTLVFGKRRMTDEQYAHFAQLYHEAKTSLANREDNVKEAIATIERELDLIGLTGVEDKLQPYVKESIEMLRTAGIKIWMLTGDKIETATCIAISTKLVARGQTIFNLLASTKNEAYERLVAFSRVQDVCLVIDGSTLQICLDNHKSTFIELASKAPSVVCCRCSPTQKAEIVKLIRETTHRRTAAIGDGGNDVSMIQAADVGLGIVGKEGKQASLAADFSITQFSFISRLLLWHGRNSYNRTARLSQFVIHRGLIITFIQCVFSSIFYFAAISVFNGYLMVGYSTFYTNFPVFSLVLDEDVSETIAFRFPELYHELQQGRALSFKTFFIWVLKSVYQGGIIMLLSIILFESNLNNIVAITFTALIMCELINVAFEINKWHRYMIASEVFSVAVYFISIIIPGVTAFEITFIMTAQFWWRVVVIVAVSCLPLYAAKYIKQKCAPPAYLKLA